MRVSRRHNRWFGQEDPWANPYPAQPNQIDTTPGYEPQALRPEDNPLPVMAPDTEPEVIYGTQPAAPSVDLSGVTKLARPAFFAWLLLNDNLPTLARAASAYFLWQWFRGEGAPVAEEIEANLPAVSRYRGYGLLVNEGRRFRGYRAGCGCK